MQPKNTKIALILGALFLGASGASNAVTGTFDITVNTIDDVVLTQDAQLDFGSNVKATAGQSCTMDADTPDTGDFNMVPDVAATNFGALTGDACITGTTGSPAEFSLTGTPGSTVVITLADVDAGDFTFTPNNNAFPVYDGATAGDALIQVAVATPTPFLVPDIADDDDVTQGLIRFAIGGDLNIVNELTQSTPYTADFQVTVIYN